MEFDSTSRHKLKKSTKRRVSNTDFGPPSVFLTLSTGYAFLNRAGLFHPTAASGIRFSGVFPAAKLSRLIAGHDPHAVEPESPNVGKPTEPEKNGLASRALDLVAIRCNTQTV
jgi:hypothetical protein